MNKPNLLQKLIPVGVAAFSAISFTGITSAPAQAGTLAWENGTSSFAGLFTPDVPAGTPATDPPDDLTEIVVGNVTVPATFNVSFSPDSIALISGVDGEFLPDFVTPAPPPYAINTLTPAEGTFNFLEFEEVVGNEPYNEFEYELDGNLVFDYGNGTTVTIADGAIFLGEIDVAADLTTPEGVEFELLAGDFIVNTDGDTYTVGEGTSCAPLTHCRVIGEVFEFAEAFNSTVGGVYDGEVVVEQRTKTPEPGTILGLLAISGLGLELKRKKQLLKAS